MLNIPHADYIFGPALQPVEQPLRRRRDENEVWKEIDGIAERHGGLCDEYPGPIGSEYEPFADFFKGVKAMRRHIFDLCNKHGIVIYAWCRRPSQCHALTDRDEIRIMQIESRISYRFHS